MKKLFLAILLLNSSFIFAQNRHYPLDGNANETINGYNGVLATGNSTPIATTDRLGNPSGAMYFDGNDYISLPDTTGMNGSEFTISAWINYSAQATILRYWFCYGTQGEIDHAGGIGPCVFGDGLYFAGYRTLTNYYELFTAGQPPTSQWYHICGVYSLNTVKFFVNGILIDTSNSGNVGAGYGANPFAFIGSRSDTIGGWIGKIDDLHYFNYALDDFQVQALVANESNVVRGNCFIDLNGNSVKDVNELAAFGIGIKSTSSTGQSFTNYTNASGDFSTLTDTGTVNTFVKVVNNYTSLPSSINTQHSSFGNVDSVSFALIPFAGITDGTISIVPLNSAVPGFISNYNLVYFNNGTDTLSGTVSLIINPGMLYMGSNPVVSSVSGDTLFWSFSNLYPLQTGVINLQLQVAPPPIINLGDTLHLLAHISTNLLDTTLKNDNAVINQIVIGSHDPNDKTVLEGSMMDTSQLNNGNYLTYVIRFQNTGTASAINVFVRDTLSSMLDWNSFEMVHASHGYNLSIMDDNILTWSFNGIMLPDSNSDEPASHGYICYRLKPLNTLLIGDVINNTAHIYFDFNPPVVTNTCVTQIVATTITSNSNAEENISISIYPNPAHDLLTISSRNLNGVISLYNSIGENLIEQYVNKDDTELRMDKFSSGVYFLKYTGRDGSVIRKVIKF